MKSKIVPLVLTALAVSFLFASGLAGISSYSAIAQSTTSGTTVSMSKGSQAPDNSEFYVPAEVTVKEGETTIHTATSGGNSTPDAKFDTSLVSPGQSSKPTAMPNEPGQYPYFCTLHPWMTGTVTVS
jgi:plastocyanin